MINKINKFISSIETLDIRLIWWILTFLAVVFARNFLEGILEAQHSIGLHSIPRLSALMFFDHFLLAWISLFFLLTILLHFLTGERIERLSRAIILFWGITLLPPILDFLITGGRGCRLSYFFDIREFPRAIINFLNPLVRFEGASVGLRIEVAIGCLLAGFYTYIKTRKILRSSLAFIGLYLIIIIFAGFLPTLFATAFKGNGPITPYIAVFSSGGVVATQSQRLALLYASLACLLAFIWFYRYSKEKFIAIVSNFRPNRSVHYAGMVVLGILLGFRLYRNAYPFFFHNPIDFLAGLGLVLAIFFAFQCAVSINDIFDVQCDKISNRNRPLVEGSLSPKEMKILAAFFALGALYFSINVKYPSFILVLTFLLFAFLYSVPPFRLKRFFPISNIIIALASLIAILTGFSIFGAEKSVYIFPAKVTLLVLITFTLSSTIVSLKDVEGDRKTRVFTLPVLFGEKNAKRIIAGLILISYLTVPIILSSPFLFIPAIILGVLNVVIVLQKKVRESIVFVSYYIFAIIISFFLRGNIEILNAHPAGEAMGYFHTGETFLERGNYLNALEAYKRSKKLLLNGSLLHSRMGETYLRLGEYNNAIEELQKAMELGLVDPQIYGFLGQAYVRNAEFQKAINIYREAIGKGIRVREIYMLVGEAYLANKEYKKAKNQFQTAINLGEHSERINSNLKKMGNHF